MKTSNNLPDNLFSVRAKEMGSILHRAVRHALLMHKRASNPVAAWKDGRVVVIPPEEIQIDDSPTAKANSSDLGDDRRQN